MSPLIPSVESACGPFSHAVQACRRADYFVTLVHEGQVHERQVHEKHFHAAHASAAPYELRAPGAVPVEVVEHASAAPYELRAPGAVPVEVVERASAAPLAPGRYGEPVSFAAPGARET